MANYRPNFDSVVQAIKAMYEKDAVHRKGFKIKDATLQLAGANLVEEVGELLVDIELKKWDKVELEAADVLIVFIHLCLMLNINLDKLEFLAVKKIVERFNFEGKEGVVT